MKVGLVQFPIEAGNIKHNFNKVKTALLRLAQGGVQLVALPEMWATGFVLPDLARFASETPEVITGLQDLARLHGMIIIGSLPEKENNRIYNTAFVVDGVQQVIGKYRKIHPFPLTHEDRYFSPGSDLPVFNCHLGSIGVIICYDLRFPELCRNLCSKGAQILVVCAQWPVSRVEHWHNLTLTRAIENQCFLIAANCCGSEGDLHFAGDSRVLGPDGTIIFRADTKESEALVDIDLSQVEKVRALFDTTVKSSSTLLPSQNKIMSQDSAKDLMIRLKQAGKTVVFTNGCFDILHVGHARYLEKARELGDFLLVAVNSDESVRTIKGSDRPINTEMNRAELLAALACVDGVVLFSESTPYELIKQFRPDILVKGSDWEEKDIVGADIVKSYGGRIERIATVEGASTTSLIRQIRKQH